MSHNLFNQIINFYDKFNERDRLLGPWGELEYCRTQAILQAHLPPSPAVILDVGGASGRYACWLAALGYEVHLIDPVAKHIEQAQAASALQPETPIASFSIGDARHLKFAYAVADVVLLMGPLYHLCESSDRMKALTEAWRVLKSGGKLFAVAISRFASTIDGFCEGYFHDPAFIKIINQDLENGQHRNHTNNPTYFTDAYFHHPEELRREIEEAGFQHLATIAIEGVGYKLKNFDETWRQQTHRDFVLKTLQKIEQEPTLIGASPHIMGVAIRS
ncbi:class I SAM-dependent methyltransferase [candidate division KSB1 bacterium]|nr:class I SAM-dependent methyltransferase [candidate division KSB1 bacterium]